MPKYEVEIRYTGTLTLVCEAKDADEAERKASAKFQGYKLNGKLNVHDGVYHTKLKEGLA